MTDHHAVVWYTAEYGGRPSRRFHELSNEERAVIRERVRLVLEGEVRRSEASPGDLAIWHGRYRTIPTLGEGEAREVLGAEPRRCHVYDTFVDLDSPGCRHRLLFDKKNIGYPSLTNIQTPNSFGWHEVLIESWYATVAGGVDVASRTLANVMVYLTVHDKVNAGMWNAHDLWLEPRRVSAGRVRTLGNFRVELTGDLCAVVENRIRIVVHLEGWIGNPYRSSDD